MRELQLSFVAPIPVGHRVRITYYRDETRGRWSRVFLGATEGAMVEDRETGVVYGSADLWQYSLGERSQHQYSNRLAAGVRAVGELEGRVTGCRVLSRIGNAGNHRIATVLTVDDADPHPAG